MSYGRLPDTAPTPLQTIRLEQSLADALVDADAWHAVARKMAGCVVDAVLVLEMPGGLLGSLDAARFADANTQRGIRHALDDLARARKVWEEAT